MDELVPKVRPMFKELICAAVSAGIYVGIATFSSQPLMISQLIKKAIPHLQQSLPVRAGEHSVICCENGRDGVPVNISKASQSRFGRGDKQPHLAALVDFFERQAGGSIKIGPGNVCLIDDDRKNVVAASRSGVHGVVFQTRGLGPTQPLSFL